MSGSSQFPHCAAKLRGDLVQARGQGATMAEQGSTPADASATERELQRSSAEFLTELGRIDGMERRKREMPGRDDQRLPLAHEIEDATISLVGLSRYQTRLIELENQSLGESAQSERKPSAILDDWRAAERVLRDARAAMERATDVADHLREEHRRTLRSRIG
jgi:hypothetical protein